jgi:hypothetical protein
MAGQEGEQAGFDPEFDDTEWTDGWLYVPIASVPPGVHPGGYRVERRALEQVEVFGRPYRLAVPLDCRFLFDPEGKLWMSDTPQERIMMYNNGRRSRGHVLVGGLGLGLYPQYAVAGAVGQATRFAVIERSPVVRDIVEPTLSVALGVPLQVMTGDVEAYLSGPVTTRYDTIFLDTWETLDAAHLPKINRLRDLALHHLTPAGRVLLWGYRWMVRLFEDACRQLLEVAPAERRSWLAAQVEASPQAVALLEPVADHFEGQAVEGEESALAWCRHFIVRLVARS